MLISHHTPASSVYAVKHARSTTAISGRAGSARIKLAHFGRNLCTGSVTAPQGPLLRKGAATAAAQTAQSAPGPLAGSLQGRRHAPLSERPNICLRIPTTLRLYSPPVSVSLSSPLGRQTAITYKAIRRSCPAIERGNCNRNVTTSKLRSPRARQRAAQRSFLLRK